VSPFIAISLVDPDGSASDAAADGSVGISRFPI